MKAKCSVNKNFKFSWFLTQKSHFYTFYSFEASASMPIQPFNKTFPFVSHQRKKVI